MTIPEYAGVYLVGAGPGDPDLLTIKAERLLRQCKGLVYDSLVPQEFLELVPNDCEVLFVGKRRGHHSFPQAKINTLLYEMSMRHLCVVRLKGGDPFLFGRGAEEAAYLVKKGVSVEIVPGVTAGIAVPAYVGIPVTHGLAGSSVTFVTGHEGIDKGRPLVNWQALAKASDGLVIYMGLHNLEFITEQLLAGGLHSTTPAAVIQQGTVIGQRCIISTLSYLPEKIRNLGIQSPSILIIGEVVNYQVEECCPQPAIVTMPINF